MIVEESGLAKVTDRIADVVFAGGTAIFPTDTVYGIGCDPMQPQALARIYALKGRDAAKPLSLHVASLAEALEYAGGDARVAAAFRRLFPGPVTLIVRRPAFICEQMTSGLATMGVRVPDYALCSEILERTGPLAATSANLSGKPAYTGREREARAALPAADLLVDAGPTPCQAESTVVDLTAGVPRLVREGVVTFEMLEQTLGRIERLSPR